ncbi:MAG: hypothetical protein ACRCSQ_07180, partial [Bacteroidales bacterium]
MKISQQITIVLGLLLFFAIPAKSNPTDVDALRLSKLKQYDFKRSKKEYNDIQLLMGNAEMGGTARQDGLGFDRLWFSDFWRTASARMPLFGPKLEIAEITNPDEYSQVLELTSGLLTTQVKKGDIAYKSEILFSEANKNLLVLKLSELSPAARQILKIQVPIADVSGEEGDRHDVIASQNEILFDINEPNRFMIIGNTIDEMMSQPKLMYKANELYPVANKMCYGIKSSAALKKTERPGVYSFDMANDEDLLLVFSQSTNWDGGSLQDNVLNELRTIADFSLIKRANDAVRLKNWSRMAVMEIPDTRHEELWYRSQFWLFATSASEKFLPGECQFGHEAWNMLPFTFGGAGWGVHDFTILGYPEKALQMLKQHHLPEAQNRNALHWLNHAQEERISTNKMQPAPYTQNPNSGVARCFAHEMQTSGDCTLLTWGNQAHLQGFALEL